MKTTIPSPIYAGAFSLLIAVRFLLLGESSPETAALFAVGLLALAKANTLQRAFRQASRLVRAFLVTGLMIALPLLAARTLQLNASTQTITDNRSLVSVPH